jgi:hypothetical protein
MLNDETQPFVKELSPAVPLRMKDVVWGVFLGMWLFAITSSIAYAAIYMTLRSTGDIH